MDVASNIRSYYDAAIPLVAPKTTKDEQGFLLMPASDRGKAFGDKAKQVVPQLAHRLRVPGHSSDRYRSRRW